MKSRVSTESPNMSLQRTAPCGLAAELGSFARIRRSPQRRGAVVVAVLILLSAVARATPPVQGGVSSGDASRMAVFVRDAATLHPIAGAHVFILSKSGRVLSEGATSSEGLTRLRKPLSAEKPAFLLAEAHGYQVAGYRWDQQYDERLVVLNGIPVA